MLMNLAFFAPIAILLLLFLTAAIKILREYQRGENSTGTEADNDRTQRSRRYKIRGCLRNRMVAGIG